MDGLCTIPSDVESVVWECHVQPVTYLISNKDCGMSMEVAQIDESEPRIAIFCCNWRLLHRCGSNRCKQATVPEKPTESSREIIKRPGLDGRAKTARTFLPRPHASLS
jgi:hypothetical protein